MNIEQKGWSSNIFFWADIIWICISKQHDITSHGILHSPKHSLHLNTVIMKLEEIRKRTDRMTVRIEVSQVRTMFKAFCLEGLRSWWER